MNEMGCRCRWVRIDGILWLRLSELRERLNAGPSVRATEAQKAAGKSR